MQHAGQAADRIAEVLTPMPAEVACPHCGGYVRGHQWIGVDTCSIRSPIELGGNRE